MGWIRRSIDWLLNRRDANLTEEIEAHRAHAQEELQRAGMSSTDAAAESRKRMGNVMLAREDSREVWVVRWADRLRQSLRYGIRADGHSDSEPRLRRHDDHLQRRRLRVVAGVALPRTRSAGDAELAGDRRESRHRRDFDGRDSTAGARARLRSRNWPPRYLLRGARRGPITPNRFTRSRSRRTTSPLWAEAPCSAAYLMAVTRSAATPLFLASGAGESCSTPIHR